MQTVILIAIITLVALLFLMNIPVKPVQWFSQVIMRMAIGVLLLFFANVFGGYIGLHIPINLFTVGISTVLGVLGVISLAAIQIFIL